MKATTSRRRMPQIVAQIESRIAEMIKDFPEPVRKAYAEQQARKANPNTPTGAYPQPVGR